MNHSAVRRASRHVATARCRGPKPGRPQQRRPASLGRAACLAAGALFAALATAPSPVRLAAEEPSASTALSPLEALHLSNLRQVTSGWVKAGEGYFAPDGHDIVFQAQSADYPFYQIYTQPLEGGPARLVSTGRGRTTCSYFSPDGKRILFASSHLDPTLSETEEAERRQQADDAASGRRRRYEWVFDPHMDLFVVDRDGSNLTRLTDAPGYDAEGAYTPDGSQIVFSSTRDGNPELYAIRSDGAHPRRLTSAPGYDGGPFVSPDGRWVLFRSDRQREGYLQIYAIGLDGRHETALTDNQGVNWAPYWHPTLPYIVWAGADHSDPNARPNYDLWLMRYEATDEGIRPGPITRLTDNPGADVLPVFSPDGTRLMWTSTRGDDHSSQLWIADFAPPATP